MAEEEKKGGDGSGGGGGNGDGGGGDAPPPKCPECKAGLPPWMATFSDMVTLLLTFFILLLSFAKTETKKYEAALGSIRDALGGNVLKQGEVIERGKSPDNAPTMLESQEPVRPFPIEFLTMEGFLDKQEINRESDEDLRIMKDNLAQHDLTDYANITEIPEGIKVRIKEKIIFTKGSTEIKQIAVEAFDRMIKLLTQENWVVFVEGHASKGEEILGGRGDAYELSSMRASSVMRALIKRGVPPSRITTVFYGDTRPESRSGRVKGDEESQDRRVEFIIRKRDLQQEGNEVHAE